MPIDTVWIVVTVPRKHFEKSIISYNRRTVETIYLSNQNRLEIPNITNEPEINNFVPSETILSDTLDFLNINDAVWIETKNGNYFHVYFPCETENNDYIIQCLKSKGIGCGNNTSIGYIPFGLFYYNDKGDTNEHSANYFNEIKDSFLKSVTSRLTVAQVVEGVKSGCEVTFDFYLYLLCSSVIAAMGIMNSSAVDVAASMMIEPLMGSVMAVAFGLALWDKDVFMTGLKSLFWGLIFCLLFGYLFGLLFQIWRVAWNPPPDGVWPTSEMQTRGEYRTLIYGAVIASAGGAILAVILLKNNICALTGVAVATTFMPPFVNAGLCFALATHLQISSVGQSYQTYTLGGEERSLKPAYAPPADYTVSYAYDMRVECLILAAISLAYTFVNIFFLGFFGFLVLKIKEIVPLKRISPTEHKFFNEDIKIYRAHRQKLSGKQIGQSILEEWAEISGLNKKELLKNTPEAKATQMQTIHDIVDDVEADESYRNITRHAFGTKHQPELRRRLTQGTIDTLTNNNNAPHLQLPNIFALSGMNRQNSISTNASNGTFQRGDRFRYSVNSPNSVWPSNQLRHRSPSTVSTLYVNPDTKL